MKQISEKEENPFTSSLNICPKALRARSNFPPPHHLGGEGGGGAPPYFPLIGGYFNYKITRRPNLYSLPQYNSFILP
jgi:hypothetical protein